jgi:hypothetical protein
LMVQVPAAANVSVVPLTVQIDGVEEVRATARPDVDVADNVGGVTPIVCVAGALNVMVCAVIVGVNRFAEQLAFAPPLLPPQLQLHGPLPVTEPVAPVEHRFAEGMLEVFAPLALPHKPLTTIDCKGAEQLALVPPLLPVQLQFHGPLPVTEPVAPAEHRFTDGAPDALTPLALPHDPFMAVAFKGAVQLALAPPLAPVQLQFHGPDPETAPALPVEHKLEDGALDIEIPLELPHEPLVANGTTVTLGVVVEQLVAALLAHTRTNIVSFFKPGFKLTVIWLALLIAGAALKLVQASVPNLY